jgi:hypothetical protein
MLQRLLPLALALTLLAAGCGGDDDDTTTTTTPPADYQAEVQTILASVGTAGTELGASASTSDSLEDVASALETFQSSVEEAADRLNALTPPEAAVEAQDELEQVLREMASGVQPAIDAANAGDQAEFQSVFAEYQRTLDGEYQQRLTAAGSEIDQALAEE